MANAVTFWKDFAVNERGFTDGEVRAGVTIASIVSMPLVFGAGRVLDVIGRRRGTDAARGVASTSQRVELIAMPTLAVDARSDFVHGVRMSKQATILDDAVEIHFENDHVTLYWNPKLRAVGTWFRPAPFGDGWDGANTIRAALEGGLELVERHSATRWIADTREMAVMPTEAQRYAADEWWPRALNAGFRWLAILLPKSTMAKMAIDEATKPSAVNPNSETRYFATVEGAKEWLRSMP